MQQLAIDFTSPSRLNKYRLSSQNKVLFEWLSEGKTINTVEARERLSIFNLHSRISDLRNKSGVNIFDKMIRIGEMNVKEYSLHPFE